MHLVSRDATCAGLAVQVLIGAVGGGCAGVAQASSLPPRSAVLEVAERVNDYWIANNSLGGAGWTRGAYFAGNQRLYEITGKQTYLDRAIAWGTANGWLRGPEGDFHADAHCCGQTYIDLYRIDPQPIRIADIQRIEDLMVASPDVDHWDWIDAFFMNAPTLAKLAATIGDAGYTNKLWEMYYDMGWRQNLFDPTEGLWYRDRRYFYPGAQTPSGDKVFWSRGNGWVMAGLCRVIAELPPGGAHRDDYISMLQTMAAALIPLQQPDGFWRSSLKDPTHYPGPETSGTGFFTYAMAWGVNQGLLDAATYLPVIADAWTGMVNTAVHPDGFLGYVQTPAAAPGATTYNTTRDYGVGAFLLAASEISLLAADPATVPDAGENQTLIDYDDDGVVRARLDGTGTTTSDPARTLSYAWSVDASPLGVGPTPIVSLPLGTNLVTLEVNDGVDPPCVDGVTISVLTQGVAQVTASDAQSPNLPANTLDLDLDTRWSALGDPQTITYDLAAPMVVRSIAIAFYNGNQRTANFDVALSMDGASWSNVLLDVDSSGTTLELETFDFPDTTGRYVRVIGHGNSVNGWNSYTEVEIDSTLSEADGDGDRLPDIWELLRVGTAELEGEDDSDGDSRTMSEEYIVGSDPGVADEQPDFSIHVATPTEVSLRLAVPPAQGIGYTGVQRFGRVDQTGMLLPSSWEPISGGDRIPSGTQPAMIPLGSPAEGTMFFRAGFWLE